MAPRPACGRRPARRSGGAPARAAAARGPLRGLPAARLSPQLSAVELDELAQEAADDAAVSVLRRLDDFRGESSFRTWAYKFALLEAAVKVRRRAWRGREVTLEPEHWESLAHSGPGPRRRRRERRAARRRARRDPDRADPAATAGARRGRARRRARSTCSPSDSTRTGTRSTSCSTTPGGACAPTSPKRDSRR